MSKLLLSKLENQELAKKGIAFDFCNDNEEKVLYKLFLEIVKEGNSYPQLLPFSYEEFLDYFCPPKSIVVTAKKDSQIIGAFYIKPNFPGRASHIANCGYIVKKEFRGQGIGFHFGKCSIDIAKELGYRGIIFNLVFKENTRSIKLWQKLGFKIIGTIPDALKKDDGTYQDALIMFLGLETLTSS